MIQNGNNKRLRYDQLCYIGNDKNIDCKNKKREEIEKEIKKKTNNKIQDENWKTLTIDTLLLLCFKNQKYATIMKDNKTWIYLLERDYSQTYRGKNAKSQYLKIQNHVKNFWMVIKYIKENFNIDQLQNSLYFFHIKKLFTNYIETYFDKSFIYSVSQGYSIILNQIMSLFKMNINYIKQLISPDIDTNYLLNLSSYVIFLGKNHYYDFLQYPLLHLSKFPSLYFSSSLPHFPSLFDSLIS